MNNLYFQNIIDNLLASGFVELVVPFVVFFALLFVAISKTKYFDKKLACLFSGILSLIVVLTHVMGRYQKCWDIVDIMNLAFPKLGFVILGFIVFFVLLLFMGVDTNFLLKYPRFLFFSSLIIIGYIVLTSKPRGCTTFEFSELPLGWIVFCVFLILMILFWKKGDDSQGGQPYPIIYE
ncbi:MAG: hypothetical protein ACQESF_04205 [Nanobdellota archaeon]